MLLPLSVKNEAVTGIIVGLDIDDILRYDSCILRHRGNRGAADDKPIYTMLLPFKQCCGSMTFWGGSGSADPCL